jgi:hypothetical protein
MPPSGSGGFCKLMGGREASKIDPSLIGVELLPKAR